MKTYLPRESAEQIQAEYARTAAQLAAFYPGRELATPMEVVLLSVPTTPIESMVFEGGAGFIVAFHTENHTICYIDEERNLIEIDYHAARTEESKR